jgi:hypothetical protein
MTIEANQEGHRLVAGRGRIAEGTGRGEQFRCASIRALASSTTLRNSLAVTPSRAITICTMGSDKSSATLGSRKQLIASSLSLTRAGVSSSR